MTRICTILSTLAFVAQVSFAQISDSYLQFANHTDLLFEVNTEVRGATSNVFIGQTSVRPWQNPLYHDVGLYVEVVLLDLFFNIYVNHKYDRFMARCNRESLSGNNDYEVEIDIKHQGELVFTLLYTMNDLPLNIFNRARYNVRFPDGTLDVDPWYFSSNESGNQPHEASRHIMINGVAHKLIYGSFQEDLDPTKDVIFSLSEVEPTIFHVDPDPSDLDDPSILNIVSYNPGILSPLTASDQEEDERAKYMYKALPKNMDFIIFQEFFDPVRSEQIIQSLLPYYPYKTDILNNDFDLPGLEMGGGVMVMSKHPILEEADYSFQDDGNANVGGLDVLADKGVKYARINKHGQIIHVFGTHTHVKDSDFYNMSQFIYQTVDWNRDDIVIMGGDMNVGAYSTGYYVMEDTLNFVEPTYMTLTHHPRQRGTIWAENHFISPGRAPNTIDFIFTHEWFKVPIVSYNEVQAYRLNSTDRDFWGIFDLGDHQPVYGRFEFPKVEDVGSNLRVCPGDELSLQVTTTLEDYTIQWYKDGNPIIGANELNYLKSEITIEDWGIYTCELTYFYAPDATINGGDFGTPGYIFQGETIGEIEATFDVVPESELCGTLTSTIEFLNASISIYPNPASEEIHIDLLSVAALDVVITDLTGKMIYESKLSESTSIPVHSWMSGAYNITLINEDGQRLNKTIAIQPR